VTQYAPSARPGSRAPHVWLEREGNQMSTIDLFGRGFVLLAGPEGGAWSGAAAQLAARRTTRLDSYTIGGSQYLADPEGKWQEGYGIDADGAVLVRPDGYVGWRSRNMAGDPGRILQHALDRILAHN
jgi:hypothetical protein